MVARHKGTAGEWVAATAIAAAIAAAILVAYFARGLG